MYHAEAAIKAGSLLVNAAMKEGKCFQLLSEDDIFKRHPNSQINTSTLDLFLESYIPGCFLNISTWIFLLFQTQHL